MNVQQTDKQSAHAVKTGCRGITLDKRNQFQWQKTSFHNSLRKAICRSTSAQGFFQLRMDGKECHYCIKDDRNFYLLYEQRRMGDSLRQEGRQRKGSATESITFESNSTAA